MDLPSRIWQQLFGRPTGGPDRLYHGPLERGEAHQERLARWTGGDRPHRLLARLADGAGGSVDAMRFGTPQAEGLEFELGSWVEDHEPDLLLDLLGERIRGLGYRRQLADTRVGEDGTRRDRTYWKPRWSGAAPPIDQLYGNVLLEVRTTDTGDRYLKVLVTRYSDRLYTPALSTAALWSALFASTRA